MLSKMEGSDIVSHRSTWNIKIVDVFALYVGINFPDRGVAGA